VEQLLRQQANATYREATNQYKQKSLFIAEEAFFMLKQLF